MTGLCQQVTDAKKKLDFSLFLTKKMVFKFETQNPLRWNLQSKREQKKYIDFCFIK